MSSTRPQFSAPDNMPASSTERPAVPTTRLARVLTRIIDFFYFPFFRPILPRQTFRYGVCGVVNMVFGWILYYLAYHYIIQESDANLGFMVFSAHTAALALIYPIIFLTGFWLNRNIAFKASPLRGRVQLIRYLLSALGSLAVNYLCLQFFVLVVKVYPTPSQMLATIVTTVYSYLMQKYFSFRGCTDE